MGDYPLFHTHRQSLDRTDCSAGGALSKSSWYVHFPYSLSAPFLVRSALPEGTLHTSLIDRLPFEPFPQSLSKPRNQPPPGRSYSGVRIFIGQLAYEMTDEQVEWLCARFGNANVYSVERIVKRNANNGLRMPTGCVHAYCDQSAAETLMNLVHKKLLIDITGVWYARTEAEVDALTEYCIGLRNSRRGRWQHLPRDSVVAQYATSDFPVPPSASNQHSAGPGQQHNPPSRHHHHREST